VAGSAEHVTHRFGSFELFGDFVEPCLDARLVDAGRAGDADPGNNLVADQISFITLRLAALSPCMYFCVVASDYARPVSARRGANRRLRRSFSPGW
jgi:hypothetical protein